jgi:type I restriction enzyme S subunit
MKLSEEKKKAGWQIVRFGDVAKEIRTTTKDALDDGLEYYVGLEHIDPQSLRLQRKGLIAEDNPTFNKRFKTGHILFGRRRAYLKKAAVADFDGICSGDITVIEALPGKLIPELLPFIVQSELFFDWAIKNSAGGLSPRVKWKSLAEFEFPLPPPDRQKAILEVLEKIENVGHLNDAQHGSGRTLFRSLSVNALRIIGQRNSEKCRLPEGWTVKRLDEISRVERGKFTPRPRNNPIYYDGEYPFVQTADVKCSGGFITGHSQTLNEKGLAVSKLFSKGSILITIAANIGEVGLTTYDTACTDSVVAIQPKKGISPHWLLFYMMQLQPYLDSIATESAQKNINLATLRPLKLAVPSSDEQALLGKILLDLFKMVGEIEGRNNTMANIQQRILGSAFNGEGDAT